jgi:hypothetical protein
MSVERFELVTGWPSKSESSKLSGEPVQPESMLGWQQASVGFGRIEGALGAPACDFVAKLLLQ